MNKWTLAGAAMVVIAAAAVPVVGWSQNPPPPPAGGPGAAPGAPGDHMGGPGREGMMRHGWERWAHKSPQQACVDRLARRAGFIASIGFKLNLTEQAQKDAWNKVITATQSGEQAQRKLCDGLPAKAEDRDKLTALQRIQHREQVLQAQLDALKQAEPAVQALYNTLTPDQKEILDHPFKRG